MRSLVSALLLGAIALTSAPAWAHDNDRNSRGSRYDYHDRYNDRGRDDRDDRHYRSKQYRNDKRYPPSAYYRPSPLWVAPGRYDLSDQVAYIIASWFGSNRGYYMQPVSVPYYVHNNLRPMYGPRYQLYALPAGLERRLGPTPYGLQRVFVNNQVLLIDRRTGNVIDRIYL